MTTYALAPDLVDADTSSEDPVVLDMEAWLARYTPQTFTDGRTLTTDPADLTGVPVHRIWSLTPSLEGEFLLVSGCAKVNVVGWRVTRESHSGGYANVQVVIPAPTDSDA